MLLPQKTHNEAEIAALNCAAVICKVDGPTPFAVAFENALSRTLAREYIEVANKATKAGVKKFKGKGTKAEVSAIMKSINGIMKDFGSGVLRTAIEDELAIFYREVTKKFIKEFKLIEVAKASVSAPGISATFTQTDKAAIEAIQKLTVQTAGTFYPEQILGITSEVVESVVLQSGLSIKEAAIKLESEIAGALGAEKLADAVPSRFATNPQNYFEIVASNASVQATSIGRINSMSDAGVEKYRVSAVIDKRTSNICTKLNNRVFSVEKASGSVEKFINLESTDGLKELLPFTNDDKVPKWADDGLGFPPYHQKCRTTVVPVF